MPTIKQIKTPDNTTYDIHGVDDKAYHTDDTEVTDASKFDNNDYIPFYETKSADTVGPKKFKVSNLINRLKTLLSLGTASTKAYTTSVTQGSDDLVTSGAVWTAIDELPEPMVFKGSLGTGGTISDLPTDGTATIGDTYKVITESDYGSGTYHGKVGDTFICDSQNTTAHTNTWTLIPSGDEPSGTVTSVTIKATSPIAVNSSSAITGSGTRTISHATSGVTADSYGDSGNQTPNYGGTFKVPYITVNDTGHITEINSHTVKIPASDNTDRYVNSASFTDDTTDNSSNPVKMTLTRAGSDTTKVIANIPKVSSTSAGVVPKGAAVSSQSQSTKFLRSDGTWQAPSYTTNTDTTYSFAEGTNQFTVTPSSGSASTVKVTPQLKIDGITSDTTDKEINCYGECSTVAGTAAKTVSITKGTFALAAGSKVIVKFTNVNTANNPTLNVNSKGAKNIFHNGARITTGANKALLAGTVEFVYDGTQFQLVGNYINTEYTAASSAPGKVASSSSTGTSTNYARQDHTHGIDLATGDANGQVKIAGQNVDVKGLGSNAYTSTSYLPLAGGRLTGNLYNKSALGNVDATANDNGISDTVYSGTIEGQDKNNRRITRLETSAYANGDICFGMNIRQWYMDTSGATPTAKQKATKGFKLTMNKAGTLSALLDGDSNADWFVGKNGLVVGNINSNYAQLTLDSGVSGDVFLTTPSSNGKLAITSDLSSYNKQVGTCNLMRYPSQHTSKSQNGLIFLDNGDGSVTVTGTATANTTYYFAVRGNNIWQVILSAGTYMLIGCPSGGSSSTYSIYCNTYIDGTTTASSGVRDTGSGATVTYDYDVSMGCYIDIKKNTAFPTNGVVFRPQIIPFGVYNFDDYIIGAPYAQTNRQLTITKADYSQIATYENTQNASRAYAKNELMIWRGALYRVTTAISSGNTISTSNVTSTTLSAEIKAIRDALNI